jgi:hypothetical protein
MDLLVLLIIVLIILSVAGAAFVSPLVLVLPPHPDAASGDDQLHRLGKHHHQRHADD